LDKDTSGRPLSTTIQGIRPQAIIDHCASSFPPSIIILFGSGFQHPIPRPSSLLHHTSLGRILRQKNRKE
jgi:hypothetical protein